MGEELHHLLRYSHAALLGLRLQDAEAQFVGRRVQIGNQPPAEARAHALLQPFEVGGRFVGGDHDLAILIDQRVEGVEEFFLRRFLAADELDIVDHQQIDRAELLLEVHRRLEAQCADELVHELLGREVDDLALAGMPANVPGHGMHQMGLAEADPAIEKQRVERHRVKRGGAGFGDASRGGVSELVGLADDEILESEARVERRELRLVLADFEHAGGLGEAG